MSEWKEYMLSDLMDIIGGGTPKTSIPEYWSGSIPWLSVVDFGNENKHVQKTEKYITELGLKSSSTKILRDGQIIISARGTVGELAVIKGNMAFNQSCYGLTAKESICHNDFLYYLLKCKIVELKRNAHGAVFDTITRTTFDSISAIVPDLPTQTVIAEILSSLDDKIELNNKINQELEKLAQTLFKQWFIDFEFPNENGEPYKSSGGEMVDSELGEIPKGWEAVRLSTLLTVKYGKDHKHLNDGIYPLYGSGGIMRYVEKPLYQYSSILIPRKGTLSNLFYLEEPFWSVDTMFYTEIHNPIYGKYLFHCIKELDIASMNVGSAVPSMTTKVLNELIVLNPNNTILSKFDEVVSAFYETLNFNNQEVKELTNLRDTLLPKLISGELEINEIKN